MSIVLDRPFAAVIFDMDGTLIDSRAAMTRSWTTWAVEYGISAEQMADWHGVPAADIVAALVGPEVREEAQRRIDELELAAVDDIVPLPGSIDALSAVGPLAAIATSCSRPLARARLGASGVPAPQVFITVDDVERGKPAPDPFLAAAQRLGVPAEECLVVEDAPKGLQAAQAAGCARLAVVTTTPADELDADLVVPDLAAVRFELLEGRVVVRRTEC